MVVPRLLAFDQAEAVRSDVSPPPGSLDRTFGGNGRVVVDFGGVEGAEGVAVTPLGRVLAVGTTNAGATVRGVIARLLPDGKLDQRFGNGGKLNTPLESIEGIAPLGHGSFVVVGGGPEGGTAKFTSQGKLDRSFGSDGIAPPFGIAVLVLPRGGLLLIGGPGLCRLGAGGHLITSFGHQGCAGRPSGLSFHSLALQKDGKIVVGAADQNDFALTIVAVRYTASGRLDPTFGSHGASDPVSVGSSAPWVGVGTQSSGKIVLTGSTLVVRLTARGHVDSTFTSPRLYRDPVNDTVFALVMQPDDKIVVVGQSRAPHHPVAFAVARLEPNGRLDRSFSGDGIAVTPFERPYAGARAATLDRQGRIVTAGAAGPPGVLGNFALARYNT
jgi:uncharacterized delta-60 repeat protein